MNYLNIKPVENIGSNFWKCCERKDGQFFMLDNNILSTYDINSEKFAKKNTFSDSISDMFYSEVKDTLLCSSKGNVYSLSEYNNTVYKSPDSLNLNLMSVATNKSGNLICAGAEVMKSVFEKDENDSLLVFWDPRNPNIPIGYYRESHSNDIVSLSFKDDHLLLSGSTDGLINVYDIRQSSENEALINVLNTEDTVNKCGWLLNNDMIYCFTGSENQIFWSCQNEDYEIRKNMFSLNPNSRFLTNCIEDTSNFILTLSISECSSEIFVDGHQTHAQICIKNDFINSANFISKGKCVIAYSDKNIYLCY